MSRSATADEIAEKLIELRRRVSARMAEATEKHARAMVLYEELHGLLKSGPAERAHSFRPPTIHQFLGNDYRLPEHDEAWNLVREWLGIP